MGCQVSGGCYSVILRVPKSISLRVGRLGFLTFAQGFYVYTGRDARSPEARIRRHATRPKHRRWHIDFLTSHAEVVFEGTVVHRSPPESECAVNRAIRNLPGADDTIPGFGASDCREGCGSHLVRFREKPQVESYAIR